MFRFVKYFGRYSRRFSTKQLPQEKIKYTSTINLPKTHFPNYLTVAKRQDVEHELLETAFAKAYSYQEAHNKEPAFVLHDGPPYANGDLHMGHAVNKILKDVTLRKYMIKGQKIHYVPGWDCHGLPIELKAMAQSNAENQNVKPLELRNKCRKFALEAMRRQKNEFISWGIMSDWQNYKAYYTFDPKFMINEMNLFYNLYEKGLVYRDLKPVYWSPSSRTALAESELEYDEAFVSPSVYVRFSVNVPERFLDFDSLHKDLYALIWTTTPWTLPANQAISYNNHLEYLLVHLVKPDGKVLENELYLIAKKLVPNFEEATNFKCKMVRYIKASNLAQFSYTHPIDDGLGPLPFLESDHVQDSKGTGLVHTAPSHGPEDFLVGLKYKIDLVNLVNDKGQYNNFAPRFLQDKDVLSEGNEAVLDRIKDDIVYSDKIKHSYPIDWRTKQPVIIRASNQWFINTESLKERALQEIEKIQIYPHINSEASKKALATQVKKRPYWCISRQRIWGVPIPVFYNKHTGKTVTNKRIIDHICDLINVEGNADFWWTKTVEEILPQEILDKCRLKADDLEKGKDIFDIWFDSGSTWSSVLPNGQIADMYLEGHDQFSGWFQSSLLISIAVRNSAPYKALFVHGFAVDEDGRKMSKSEGNVISPIQIASKYGVDTLRWWVAAHATQNMSIAVSDKLSKQSAENVHKARAIIRYLIGVIGQRPQDTAFNSVSTNRNNHLNKYLLSHLVDLDQEVTKHYDSFEYNRVVAALLNFITNRVSACYVHLIKDRLYCGDNKDFNSIRFTLSKCYEILCKSLWPITPFLVEESWKYYDPLRPFHEHVITLDPAWKNDEVVQTVDNALEVKHLINQKAGYINTWQLAVNIKCHDESKLNLLRKLQPTKDNPVDSSELTEILQVGNATLNKSPHIESGESYGVILAPLKEKELCPRCRRFAIDQAEKVCFRCKSVLKIKGRDLS